MSNRQSSLCVGSRAILMVGLAGSGVGGCGPLGDDLASAPGHIDAQAEGRAAGVAHRGGASRYPVVLAPSTWVERQTLLASDAAPGGLFGNSVALSGDTAFVAARHGVNGEGAETGSAYVFARNATGWVEQDILFASDGAALDEFGSSVALSGDTALVGANRYDGAIGAAYVFVRSATSWLQQQKLTAGDRASSDEFGWSVALSGDAALVGASGEDEKGNGAGAAYIFERSASGWAEQSKLTASDAEAYDLFGVSVALSGDVAVVGADSEGERGSQAGAAYVFAREGAGWPERQKLLSSDGLLPVIALAPAWPQTPTRP